MIAALLTTVFFSLSAVTANRSVRYMAANEANFWRLAFATFFLGLYAFTWGIGMEGDSCPWFILSGVIGFGLGDIALFQAYPRLGSRLTVLIVHCLAVPLAVVTEWIWLQTVLTPRQLFYSAAILAGIVLALAPGKSGTPLERKWLSGIAFATLAAIGQGGGAVVSRKAYSVAEAAGFEVDGISAAFQRILAGLALAGLSVLAARRLQIAGLLGWLKSLPPPKTSRWKKAWPWIVVNALMGPALGVACFQWALQTTPTGIVLPVVALTPLVVIPFARFMEGETPALRSLIGGAIAVAGVILLTITRT